jgi:hypothetical protein
MENEYTSTLVCADCGNNRYWRFYQKSCYKTDPIIRILGFPQRLVHGFSMERNSWVILGGASRPVLKSEQKPEPATDLSSN